MAQRLLNSLGSVHNLQFARLATARKFLLVEGDDVAILKRFQNALFPQSGTPLDTVTMDVGGWGGWAIAVASAHFLDQNSERNIACYSIFDSDYHTVAEIEKRRKDATSRGIHLHIWRRKELENYLLASAPVFRIIAARSPQKHPTVAQIEKQLDAICESLKMPTERALGSEFQKHTKGMEFATASEAAAKQVAAAWATRDGRLSIIPGKKALAQLSDWANRGFGVSLTAINIAREMQSDEVDPEVVKVVTSIERSLPF